MIELEFNFKSALLSNYNMLLLNELQNSTCDTVLSIRKKSKKYISSEDNPPLLNQATFLSHGYICLVWLWENLKKEGLEKYLEEELTKSKILTEINVVEKGKNRKLEKASDYLRLIRNAISHANVKVDENNFSFKDNNPRDKEDYGTIEMKWAELARLSDTVFHKTGEYLKNYT